MNDQRPRSPNAGFVPEPRKGTKAWGGCIANKHRYLIFGAAMLGISAVMSSRANKEARFFTIVLI
jgi:hypothetical protein